MPRGAGSQEERIVTVARIGAAHGLRGLFWVHLSNASPAVLAGCDRWHLRAARSGEWREARMLSAVVKNDRLLAGVAGVEDRKAAQDMCGQLLGIERRSFPRLATGEYYWCDLEGLRVLDEDGAELGVVARLASLPENDLLVVEAGGKMMQVPFIDAYIKEVDMGSGVIHSRWRDDY